MKRILVLSLLLLTTCAAFAEEQILFSGKLESGAWAAPAIKFSSFNDQFAVYAGAQGGWIVNHRGLLGLGVYGLATTHRPPFGPRTYHPPLRTDVTYGGIILGYVFESDKLVHTVFDVLIGGGALTLSEDDHNDEHDGVNYPNDGFFVMEPTLSAEVNLTKFLRTTVGLGYRFVNGVDSWGYTSSNVAGPTCSVVVKFGKF